MEVGSLLWSRTSTVRFCCLFSLNLDFGKVFSDVASLWVGGKKDFFEEGPPPIWVFLVMMILSRYQLLKTHEIIQ